MTILVGQDGTGWTEDNHVPQGAGGNAVWLNAGYSPTVTATATTAKVKVTDWQSATKGKILVYRSSDGVLLASSSEFAPADGTGLLSKTISVSVTIGTDLKLAWIADNYTQHTGNTGSSSFADNQSAMTYATPDDPLPAGSNGGREIILWLDGTAGGGSIVLMGQACL
jgi:hypothetical protein